MNTIPIIPSPTTTTLFLLLPPLLDSDCAPLTAMISSMSRHTYLKKEEGIFVGRSQSIVEMKLNQEDKVQVIKER
jgi:hypothetical protein